MGIYSRLTGENIPLPDPREALARRLARMRRIVWLGICALKEALENHGGQLVMYTLTYAKVGEWAPRHICNMVRWLRRQGITRYVWVGELQKRGAVHYHLLALLPGGQRWCKPSADDGGWANGYTWVTPNIKRPFYIMKYLQKGQGSGEGQRFPQGFRLYAVCQRLIREASFALAVDWRLAQAPAWFNDGGKDDSITLSSKRVLGGVRYGGLVEYSPYATKPCKDVAYVEQMMYAGFYGAGHLPQGLTY